MNLQDISHVIGKNFTCSDCGILFDEELTEAAVQSGCDLLVDAGGLGVFYPASSTLIGKEAVKCTHPSVKKDESEEIVIESKELTDEDLEREGLERVQPPSSAPFEKQLRSAQFDSWQALREATKPSV